jgi:hypothetical protein
MTAFRSVMSALVRSLGEVSLRTQAAPCGRPLRGRPRPPTQVPGPPASAGSRPHGLADRSGTRRPVNASPVNIDLALRAPRLEPCSDDRGQTSYEGSDNNAQRADKRNDNGVRDLNAQRGHSSNALPRSALARSRVVAEPLEPCPSLVKFAVGYTHEPCATKRPEPSRDPMRGLRTGSWASRADARGLPLYRTRGARQRPLSLVGPYGPRPAASNPSRQYRPPTTRPAGAGSYGASLA